MAHARASIGTVDYATSIATGHHTLAADEGPELGGKDAGPAPYDLLTSALGACTVITLRMYAERKEWNLGGLHIKLRLLKDADAQHIERTISTSAALDAEQQMKLLEIADKTPVTKALAPGVRIQTVLEAGV